jgi:hypothetical protein
MPDRPKPKPDGYRYSESVHAHIHKDIGGRANGAVKLRK